MRAVEEKENFEKSYFCSRPLFLEIFKLDKSGVFYMSIAFHSRITSQNWSKNERAMPNDAFGPRRQSTQKFDILKPTSHDFCRTFKEKAIIQIG